MSRSAADLRLRSTPERTGSSRPLSPQQSLATIHTKKDLAVELVAAEPLLASPVAIDWGPDGRLWVAEMIDYPAGRNGDYKPGGRIRVLEDTHGDGRYDKATIFLDHIPFPTGVTAWRKGVLVSRPRTSFMPRMSTVTAKPTWYGSCSRASARITIRPASTVWSMAWTAGYMARAVCSAARFAASVQGSRSARQSRFSHPA